MSRPSTYETKILEQVERNVQATREDLISILEHKDHQVIYVTIQYYDNQGKVLGQRQVEIRGEKYKELMSESPVFAPGKPINEYREVDLWYIIDQINGK